VFSVTRPRRDRLEQILERARSTGPSYAEVGATRTGAMPPGYRHDTYEEMLGSGLVWERAVTGLREWIPHRGAGAEIFPSVVPLEEGGTLLVLLRPGPLFAIAVCRIVYVIDDADRFGFAYGTLPGHPEQGEEAFVVERRDNGVVFRVIAFSRPIETLARLGSPVARMIQRRVTLGYLSSLRDFCAR
jgi:uncharacterized protein (UPF0548 family)